MTLWFSVVFLYPSNPEVDYELASALESGTYFETHYLDYSKPRILVYYIMNIGLSSLPDGQEALPQLFLPGLDYRLYLIKRLKILILFRSCFFFLNRVFRFRNHPILIWVWALFRSCWWWFRLCNWVSKNWGCPFPVFFAKERSQVLSLPRVFYSDLCR